MTRYSFVFVVVFQVLLAASPSFAKSKPVVPQEAAESKVLAWDTEEGMKRFARAEAKADFFKLANHFESQSNKIYCGPTTAAIVLNAFRIGKDGAPFADSGVQSTHRNYHKKFDARFKKYTQRNFFSGKALRVKTEDQVNGRPIAGKKDFGLQLRQLHEMLKAHGLQSEIHVAKREMKVDEMKKSMIENLKNGSDFVIVNYKRKALGQEGGGHISPLGAYDEESDSFLVLDVNPNKAPWAWVKSTDLLEAMQTFDTIENRGFLLVKDLSHP